MAVSGQIVQAAGSLNMSAGMLEKSFAGFTVEEWHKSPGECSNGMIWIVGHLVWARSRALTYLGADWSRPWLAQFGRGGKRAGPDQCPSAEEVVAAWHEVKAAVIAALENASEEALSAPSPPGPPSFDGKLSGLVSFFANHEAYHVGQAGYLSCWLGHGRVAG